MKLGHQATSCELGRGKVERGGYILSKANEILMVGVDVGQLNVNQQQNLNRRQRNQSSH